MSAVEFKSTPDYLLRIVFKYLSNKLLLYDTDEGCKEYRVSGEVPLRLR